MFRPFHSATNPLGTSTPTYKPPVWRVRVFIRHRQIWRKVGGLQPAMASSDFPSIVTAEWLASNLNNPDVRVLDASWFLPSMGRNAQDEFRSKRIPGSKFFDLDGVANRESSFPHMLPSEAAFAAAADALGVCPNTAVVLYDRMGTFSAPRAWWTWKIFGHEKVAILDGGFPSWEANGLPTECTEVSDEDIQTASRAAQSGVGSPRYLSSLNKSAVCDMDAVQKLLDSGEAQLVDARASGRFRGLDPEPRADLPSGHMRGAINVPFMNLLEGNTPTGKFRSPDDIRAQFAAAGVDFDKPIVCTCGSGATAAVLVHGLHQLGVDNVALYDGSWMEWASTPGNEIISEARP